MSLLEVLHICQVSDIRWCLHIICTFKAHWCLAVHQHAALLISGGIPGCVWKYLTMAAVGDA